MPLTWLLAVAGWPSGDVGGRCRCRCRTGRSTVGLLLALLVTVTRAGTRCPTRSGVNVTVTVQDAPTASVRAVVGLAEVAAWRTTPETVADVVPELVTVTVCVGDGRADDGAGEGQAGRVRR